MVDIKKIYIFILTATFSLSGYSKDVPPPLKDHHQDFYHPAACSTEELVKLKNRVVEAAGNRNPEDAWKVVHAMVCEEGETTEKFVLSRMLENLEEESFDYEEGITKYNKTKKSTKYLAKLAAWSIGAAEVEGNISVSYWASQYCVNGFSLSFNENKWQIFRVGGACD